MKKLLIVSDPPARPGFLPRLRYLCDYLVRKGYDVTLLTEEYQPLEFEHDYPIETIRMYNGTTFDWFIKTVWTLLTDWHDRVFAKRALLLLQGHYDAVICTAFSDFPLGAALRIANAMNIPLICDIRDLDEQVEDSTYQYKHQLFLLKPLKELYRAIHIKRRNKVLQAAKAVTTVSPWHADFIKQFNEKVQVVYNGYDEQQFYPKDIPTDSFRIIYIGSLFDWQKPALELVRQIAEELHITIDIHTPKLNPISHKDLGDTIRQSGIMLVLTSPKTHGMLTTKFYEALGCEKPVLCVPSDHGALAELMEYTHAGLATDDAEAIKAFIQEKYNEWKQNGFTRQSTQHREEFSRETQCHQIEALL